MLRILYGSTVAQLSYTGRHLKGPTHFMPSRQDAILPSMTFSMVYIGNFFFLIDCTCPIKLLRGKNNRDLLHRDKEMEE